MPTCCSWDRLKLTLLRSTNIPPLRMFVSSRLRLRARSRFHLVTFERPSGRWSKFAKLVLHGASCLPIAKILPILRELPGLIPLSLFIRMVHSCFLCTPSQTSGSWNLWTMLSDRSSHPLGPRVLASFSRMGLTWVDTKLNISTSVTRLMLFHVSVGSSSRYVFFFLSFSFFTFVFFESGMLTLGLCRVFVSMSLLMHRRRFLFCLTFELPASAPLRAPLHRIISCPRGTRSMRRSIFLRLLRKARRAQSMLLISTESEKE